jgi:phosphoglycerate dehydrogenase-like enzyme
LTQRKTISSKPKLLIVVYHRFSLWRAPDWFAERLRREFPEYEVVQLEEYAGIEQHLADTEITITWSLRPEQVKASPRLRWIHSPAAAVHLLMIPEIIRSEIVVTSARGVHGPVVAEHVMALVLAMARRLPSAFRYQQQARWAQDELWAEFPRPREIAGGTLGLVGLGSIGLEVARLAKALGMKVVAVRLQSAAAEHVDQVFTPALLDTMLAMSDYVVLAAPVTPQTRGLLNAGRLAAMKPGVYLINVARGALIDEPALIEALRQKRIAGAALDVFEHEPLPAESPLWKLENVLLTPHSAALTEKLWERHYSLFSDNLRRFRQGAPLLGVVDKRRGY